MVPAVNSGVVTAADTGETPEEIPLFRSVGTLSRAPSLPAQESSWSLAVSYSGNEGIIETEPLGFHEKTPPAGRSNLVGTARSDSPVGSGRASGKQQRLLGWKQPVVTDLGCFSFLEPYHTHVPEHLLSALLQYVPTLLAQLSLHVVEYSDSPVRARATTLEQVGLVLSVDRDTRPCGADIVLQVQRRSGCCMVFSKYAREIVYGVDRFVGQSTSQSVRNQAAEPPGARLTTLGLVNHETQNHGYERLLDRCHLPNESSSQSNYHFYNVQDAAVLTDTSAMLQCYATRYLALEALVILTDPSKTTQRVAQQVAHAILGGWDNDCMKEGALELSPCALNKLVQTVARLALSGQWEEDDCGIHSSRDAQHCDSRAQHLALQALTNAMQVVECHSKQSMAALNAACLAQTGCDWAQCLSQKVYSAHSQPHFAFFAAKGLCRVYESQVKAGAEVNGLCLEHALLEKAMDCPHAALQAACRNLSQMGEQL